MSTIEALAATFRIRRWIKVAAVAAGALAGLSAIITSIQWHVDVSTNTVPVHDPNPLGAGGPGGQTSELPPSWKVEEISQESQAEDPRRSGQSSVAQQQIKIRLEVHCRFHVCYYRPGRMRLCSRLEPPYQNRRGKAASRPPLRRRQSICALGATRALGA